MVHCQGYGTKAIGKADLVTPDTVFPLASCTKAFTSTLLGILADEGQLDWDDRVRKHLPIFRLSDEPADQLVTLRDLLCHRSGLGGHDLLWYRAPWDHVELIRKVAKLPLSAPFRGGYQYSSLGFQAAGLAAANRAQSKWETLVEEKILQPLGMKSAVSDGAGWLKVKDRAQGHQREAGKVLPMPPYLCREADPAGSLAMSVRDLGPWLILQLNEGQFAGKAIVSAANLAETKQPHTPMRLTGSAMLSTYPESTQVSYALGWVIFDYRGKLVVSHGGIIDGFRTQITLLPKEKIAFALVNNLHETRMNQALTYLLIDEMLGLTRKDWNRHFLDAEAEEAREKAAAVVKRNRDRQPDAKPSLELKQYAVQVTEPAYGDGEILFENGQLVWKWSDFRCGLEPWSGETFRITSGHFVDELLQFQATGNGVSGLTFRGILFTRK
jgi:CubicO group peptidase (beta-lactamase class C family)